MSKALFTASIYSHIVQFYRPYLAAFRRLGWTVDVACGGTPTEIPEARQVVYIFLKKEMFSPAMGRPADSCGGCSRWKGTTW